MHVLNIVVPCHDSLRRHNGGCKFFVIYKIPAQHGHPSNNFSNVSDLRRTHHADPTCIRRSIHCSIAENNASTLRYGQPLPCAGCDGRQRAGSIYVGFIRRSCVACHLNSHS